MPRGRFWISTSLRKAWMLRAGQRLAAVQTELKASRESKQEPAALEALLFRDVLGVKLETLQFLSGLPEADRTYADSVVANWNQLIDERLDLSRYWQQDDQFILRANLKKGTIFFEITDKTGAVLFLARERSSGLRYFLSYYIPGQGDRAWRRQAWDRVDGRAGLVPVGRRPAQSSIRLRVAREPGFVEAEDTADLHDALAISDQP